MRSSHRPLTWSTPSTTITNPPTSITVDAWRRAHWRRVMARETENAATMNGIPSPML